MKDFNEVIKIYKVEFYMMNLFNLSVNIILNLS